jgi:hypothetical protein
VKKPILPGCLGCLAAEEQEPNKNAVAIAARLERTITKKVCPTLSPRNRRLG